MQRSKAHHCARSKTGWRTLERKQRRRSLELSLVCLLLLFAAGFCSSDAQEKKRDYTIPVLTFDLTLDPPTTNADGTQLLDLRGFKIYICEGPITAKGRTPSNSKNVTKSCDGRLKTIDINSAAVTSYQVKYRPTTPVGLMYFRATAYDHDGHESEFSELVTSSFDLRP